MAIAHRGPVVALVLGGLAVLGCGDDDAVEPGGSAGSSGGSAGGGAAARAGAAGEASGGAGRTGSAGAGRGGAGGSGARAGSGGTTAEGGDDGGAGRPASGGGGDASGAAGEGASAGEGGATCVARYSGQKPLDLFLLVEQTRFLADPLQVGSGSYFEALTAALGDFVTDADAGGIGVAAGYFPLPAAPDSCTASYTSPELDAGLLPGAADALLEAFAAHAPTDDVTAITPALSGAIEFMKARSAAHPERTPVVVLLATLADIACTTWDDLYALAQAGYVSTPSVATEVVSLLADSSRSLSISSASLRNPYIVDSGGDVRAQVHAALLDLANPAKTCRLDYPVFEPPVPFTDDDVSLLYTPNATGVAVEVSRVASAGACDTRPGWYLEEGPPKALVACPAACDTFTAGYLSARVACPR